MSHGSEDAEVESLILELYRSASSTPLGRFQDCALRHLGAVVRFDAAWWGRATSDPPKILHVHLLNARECILDDYRDVQAHDFFRDAMLAEPGRSISMLDLMPRPEYIGHPLYTRYCRHHRVEDALGTILRDEDTALSEFLTVWRFDARWPFSAIDRSRMQRVMPHLAESFRISRLLSLQEMVTADLSPVSGRAWSLIDGDAGCLVEASSEFVDLVREAWPEWRGASIPASLFKALGRRHELSIRSLKLRVDKVGDYLFLLVRRRSVFDQLGGRERDVVRRFATARSYRDVAAQLGTSPVTVRNQVASVYRKLNIHSKTELVQMLARLDEPPVPGPPTPRR